VSGVDGVAQAQQADTGANKREFHLYCHPFWWHSLCDLFSSIYMTPRLFFFKFIWVLLLRMILVWALSALHSHSHYWLCYLGNTRVTATQFWCRSVISSVIQSHLFFIHISHIFCPLSFISRSKSSLWTPLWSSLSRLYRTHTPRHYLVHECAELSLWAARLHAKGHYTSQSSPYELTTPKARLLMPFLPQEIVHILIV
jgi:hypothetical protein